jgi:hypothetical protein
VLKERRQFFPEHFVYIMRSPGGLYVIVSLLKYFRYVILSAGEIFSVSVESVLYQKKVCEQFFTELHVYYSYGEICSLFVGLLHCHQVVGMGLEGSGDGQVCALT